MCRFPTKISPTEVEILERFLSKVSLMLGIEYFSFLKLKRSPLVIQASFSQVKIQPQFHFDYKKYRSI